MAGSQKFARSGKGDWKNTGKIVCSNCGEKLTKSEAETTKYEYVCKGGCE